MRIKDLQKIVNESIEMWYWENIVCIVDENYKPPKWTIRVSVPVLTLDNFHHWFDWNTGKTFLSFKDKWEVETSA